MDKCLVYQPIRNKIILSDFKKIFQVIPVTVSKLSCRQISSSHWHDYLQIWYTVSGSFLLTVGGVTYEQKPGSAMLIFPYTKHSIDSSKSDMSETTVISISIRKDTLESNSIPFLPHTYDNASFDSIHLDSNLLFSGKDKEAADRICMELLAESGKRASMQFSKQYTLIADFLELCANQSEKLYSKREIITAQSRNACIDKAMAYLLDNSKKRIDLTDASNAAMMSKSNFTASFHAVTGQSCHSYINMLRMHYAIDLLRHSEKSISEIAKECGYYDHRHFRRQCVEIHGTSPMELRRELSQWTREYGYELYLKAVRDCSWALSFDEDRIRCAMSFY